jgi:hypothetical protein
MKGFAVTFERYLPHDESDDISEPDESGFVIENATLRDAMSQGLEYSRPEWSGSCEPDSYPPRGVRWLNFYNWNESTRDDIERGIKESRSLHFPQAITESSRRRICRLFGAT